MALESVYRPVVAAAPGFLAIARAAPNVSEAPVAEKSCVHCGLAEPVVLTQAAMMFPSVFSSATGTVAPAGSVPGAAPLAVLTSALAFANAFTRPVLLAPLAPMFA